jgi:hypothetical protein
VPGVLIWLTASPPGILIPLQHADRISTYLALH